MKERTYRVKIEIGDSTTYTEITEVDFCTLSQAHSALKHALLLEEKYEILLGNYLDLEQEELKIITENKLYSEYGHSGFFRMRLRIDRRLLNFLAAARLYIDHSKQDAKKCVETNGKESERLDAVFKKEYDSHFEYRFMEALRNHTQHQGLPVHHLARGAGWNETRTANVYNFSASSLKRELKKAKNFKAAILEEMPEQVNLRAAAKVYLECISRAHQSIRTFIDSDVVSARSKVMQARSSYLGKQETGFLTLQALNLSDVNEEFALMLDWDEIRTMLQEKNRMLVSFRYRQVGQD